MEIIEVSADDITDEIKEILVKHGLKITGQSYMDGAGYLRAVGSIFPIEVYVLEDKEAMQDE